MGIEWELIKALAITTVVLLVAAAVGHAVSGARWMGTAAWGFGLILGGMAVCAAIGIALAVRDELRARRP